MNLAVSLAAAADNNFAELAAVYLTLLRYVAHAPPALVFDD